MASAQRNVDFILEQMAEAGDVSARKMFGEYGIYCRGKLVALFCDDQLFIKPTDAGRAYLAKVKEAPPYPGAKPYFLISGDQCEDGEWLSELVRVSEQELPPPKPKASPKRPPKTAKTTRKATEKSGPSSRRKAAPKPRAHAVERAAKKPSRHS